ncbi:MAG TPA: sensor histidine kinase [Kribbella sp.]|nr:sensor histidine kinase [Kribbella sp.]
MGAPTRWHGRLSAHPVASDVTLALVLLVINLLQPGDRQGGQQIELTPTAASLSFVACAALVFRRKQAMAVLAITAAATVAYAYLEGVKSPIELAVAVAMYTVVVQKDRLTRTAAAGVTVLVLVCAATAFTDEGVLHNLSVGVLVLLATAIGEAVRYRRAYEAEIEERIRRAEQSREEEAERRVIEERMRIAHELHDVIAHHIALMNVQAGVASHLLREKPAEADRALALVRDSGRTVLQELTVLLGVLRRSGDTSLPTAPTPSLDQLGPLIESFAAAGLKVDWQPAEAPGPLPDVVELTAYRIVQESLTNVVKHAPGAVVRIGIHRQRGSLAVDVTDDGGTTARPLGAAGSGTGHGLLGMRERVTAVGGDLSAGPVPGGGFHVHAVLPLPSQEGVVRDDPGIAGRRPDADPERVPGSCRLSPRPGSGG